MKQNRHYGDMLETGMKAGKTVCVGLDPDIALIPKRIRNRVPTIGGQIVAFCKEIINAMPGRVVLAYKLNMAFYAAHRNDGYSALETVIDYIHLTAPEIPVILDGKRGDIGNTNVGYVSEAFEWFGADAVTVSPYLGSESLSPFLRRPEKGIIVLCRTSNPESNEFQGSQVIIEDPEEIEALSALSGATGYVTQQDGWIQVAPFYQHVAYRVARHWNQRGNCGLVVGATYPKELGQVRLIAPDLPFLIPGIGAQGGDVEATVQNGRNSAGNGMIINSSRGIIYAEDPRTESLRLDGLIRQFATA